MHGAQRPRARNRAQCSTAPSVPRSPSSPLFQPSPPSPPFPLLPSPAIHHRDPPSLHLPSLVLAAAAVHCHRLCSLLSVTAADRKCHRAPLTFFPLHRRDPDAITLLSGSSTNRIPPTAFLLSPRTTPPPCASLHHPSSLPISLLLPSGRRTPSTADASPPRPPLPSPLSSNIASTAAASALPSLRSLSTSPSTPVKPSPSSFIVTASSIARTAFFLPVVVDPPATAASSLCPSVSDHRPNHRLSALLVGSSLADDRGHPPYSLLLYWKHRASLPQSLLSSPSANRPGLGRPPSSPPCHRRREPPLSTPPGAVVANRRCRPPHRAPPVSSPSFPADRGKNLPLLPVFDRVGDGLGREWAVGPWVWAMGSCGMA